MVKKKSILLKNTNEIYQDLLKLEGPTGNLAIDFSRQKEFTVSLRVNKDVAVGLFKPDPLIPGGYLANAVTLKALRKDIFVTDFELDEFTEVVTCEGCRRELDLQFWFFCPYCETKFKSS